MSYDMLIQANGINIFYEKAGEGRPFILLHGNGEDHSIFQELAHALSKEYCVYSPDTRCHGKSASTPKLSYSDMAEDVAAFITALKLEKPLLLGFSDGGITGLLLAIKYPEMLSGLIACGANTQPSQIKKWFLTIIKLQYIFNKDPKLRLMLTEPDISAQELNSIKTPTLLLAGERDIVKTSATKRIAASVPNSELIILKGQTHSSYIMNHSRVLSAVQPFLSGMR